MNTSLIDLLEDMQRQIQEQKKRIESLESAEYNRVNILFLTDDITAPSTVSGWGQIYIDTSDGDLKIKFGDGKVTTIAADT